MADIQYFSSGLVETCRSTLSELSRGDYVSFERVLDQSDHYGNKKIVELTQAVTALKV